jgi:hypothetical protein
VSPLGWWPEGHFETIGDEETALCGPSRAQGDYGKDEAGAGELNLHG